MEVLSDYELWLGIFAFDTGHHPGSDFRAHNIDHRAPPLLTRQPLIIGMAQLMMEYRL